MRLLTHCASFWSLRAAFTLVPLWAIVTPACKHRAFNQGRVQHANAEDVAGSGTKKAREAYDSCVKQNAAREARLTLQEIDLVLPTLPHTIRPDLRSAIVDVVRSVPSDKGGVLLTAKILHDLPAHSRTAQGSPEITCLLDPVEPIGHPAWPGALLGKAGPFFGFNHSREGRTATFPDFKALNGAIAKANEFLPANRRIGTSFYEVREKNFGTEKYVKRWIASGGLPLATSGFLFYHDLSYHIATLLFPPEVLAGIRSYYETAVSFIDQRLALDTDLRLRQAMYQILARDLDTGLGNAGGFLGKIAYEEPATWTQKDTVVWLALKEMVSPVTAKKKGALMFDFVIAPPSDWLRYLTKEGLEHKSTVLASMDGAPLTDGERARLAQLGEDYAKALPSSLQTVPAIFSAGRQEEVAQALALPLFDRIAEISAAVLRAR